MGSDQDSGASSRVSLAKYDPESSSWKMSQTLLFEDSDASLETFARSGTMRSGKLYQRKTPVRLTCENAYSSSLPTPTARDWKDGTAKSCQNVPVNALLGRAVHHLPRSWWPTPRASIGHKGIHHWVHSRGKGNLEEEAGASVPGGGKLNPRFVQWLMGFPAAWLNCVLSETRSSRKSRSASEEEPCESSNAAQ